MYLHKPFMSCNVFAYTMSHSYTVQTYTATNIWYILHVYIDMEYMHMPFNMCNKYTIIYIWLETEGMPLAHPPFTGMIS